LILDFYEQATAVVQRLRKLKIHIGTMDLRIAAIGLAYDAVLLTGNLGDFRKVPDLRAEDWASRPLGGGKEDAPRWRPCSMDD